MFWHCLSIWPNLILRQHLDWVSKKHGCLPYFSLDIQNKLINQLGGRVHQTIISSFQKADYYSVLFHMTFYSAHIEEMLQTDTSAIRVTPKFR